jgi:hypothetical protein
MTTQELLLPRYECIAPYPGIHRHPYKVKDVITVLEKGTMPVQSMNERYMHLISINGKDYESSCDFEAFPHLFRLLKWFERRDIADMPKYIAGWGEVFAVYEWVMDGYGWAGKVVGAFEILRPLNDPITPATEQEYNDYIKIKQ